MKVFVYLKRTNKKIATITEVDHVEVKTHQHIIRVFTNHNEVF